MVFYVCFFFLKWSILYMFFFFFSSRRRHTRSLCDWSSDVCSSDLTVMKALAAGVPMVVLPHGRDQADTAARITARGAGIALARTASCDAIRGTVQHVLRNDSFTHAARRLGEVIRRDAEGNALVDELEAITNTGSVHCVLAPHLYRGGFAAAE